jgi:hypothetical protein
MEKAGLTPKMRWVFGGLLAVLACVAVAIWLRWPSQELPRDLPGNLKESGAGWKIRYNANASLAVKGSKKVKLALLREMLDENQQMVNFRVKLQDGKDVPDENGARSAILTTLKAIAEWHKKCDVRKAYRDETDDLRKVYAAIEKLAKESPSIAVRKEAKAALESVGGTS